MKYGQEDLRITTRQAFQVGVGAARGENARRVCAV